MRLRAAGEERKKKQQKTREKADLAWERAAQQAAFNLSSKQKRDREREKDEMDALRKKAKEGDQALSEQSRAVVKRGEGGGGHAVSEHLHPSRFLHVPHSWPERADQTHGHEVLRGSVTDRTAYCPPRQLPQYGGNEGTVHANRALADTFNTGGKSNA